MQFYNTGHLPEDLAELSFANNIARIMPNGEAPLFAMSGLARKKKALQIEHGYWSKTMQFGKITLGAAVASATATTITVVDSGSVTANDLIRFNSSFNTSVFVAPEIMKVVSVDSATSITVIRGFANTTAKTSISNGTLAPVIGNAYPEGSPKPPSKAILPQRHLNYTHIFRNGWSQSKTLAKVQQIVGQGTVAENKMDCSQFHSRDIELATFFSRKSQTTDAATGQPIHTMAGIEQLIEEHASGNLKEAGATTTYKQLIDMVDSSFDQRMDMMNGNHRVAYCGKKAINVINEIGRLSGNYQIVEGATSFGLKFSRVKLPRGTLDLIEHPIFSVDPEWEKLMVIGELSSFDFAYLEGRDTEVTYINEDPKSTDGQDASGGVLTTELTIELQNPFAWMFIYNLRAAAV